MKNFSLKALGATLLTSGLVFAGFAAPAFAATPTMNRTAVVVPGNTNTLSASVLFDATPSGVDSIGVRNNTSKITFTSTTVRTQVMSVGVMGVPCGTSTNVIVKVTNGPADIYCTVNSTSILVEPSGASTFATGLIFTVQLSAGAMSFNATGPWPLFTALQSSALPVTGYYNTFDLTDPNAVVSYNAAFDGNGGTGSSPTPQSSSSGSTSMPANTYTKSGFTFAGWRSGSATVGTVYQAGESAPLTANTTFYAQWTDSSASGSNNTLANTGFDAAPYLSTGAVLALAGAVLILFARRRQTS